MLEVGSTVVNLASGAVVAVVLFFSVPKQWMTLSFILYGALLGACLFVRDGGQFNAAIATSAVAYLVLSWTASGIMKPLTDSGDSEKEKVEVFTGTLAAASNWNTVFDTFNPASPSYRRLPVSRNRHGGQQFSYSVWVLFTGGLTDESVAGKTLFMRGDKKRYEPKQMLKGASSFSPYFPASQGGVAVACPRVYFVSANQLGIQVNTDHELVAETVVGNGYSNRFLRNNALSLVPHNWALMTFVFQDNAPTAEFANGVSVKMFLNDVLYHSASLPGSMRLNSGDLHLLPLHGEGEEGFQGLKLSNLTYYNWALSSGEVSSVYSKGPKEDTSSTSSDWSSGRTPVLSLGAQNAMDFTNYHTGLEMIT